MNREPNDMIGKIAAMCLVACVVAAVIGGMFLTSAQAAIDESIAQQEALAYSRCLRMCVAVERAK